MEKLREIEDRTERCLYIRIYIYIREKVVMKEIVDESRFVRAMIDYDLSNSK